MLHEDLPGARAKLAEAAGWVEKARGEAWYEPDDAVDAVLPFVNEELGWDDTTRRLPLRFEVERPPFSMRSQRGENG